MNEKTVVVLGAGATKACGGPLTNEILPGAFGSETKGNYRKTHVWTSRNWSAFSSKTSAYRKTRWCPSVTLINRFRLRK